MKSLYFLCAVCLSSVAFAESDSPPGERLYEAAQQTRARSGLPRQAANPELMRAAQQWADHLANSGQFYHGPGRMEIIAYAGGSASEATGITTWLNSGAHRAFLLGNTAECGYGMAVRNGRTLYCGIFSKSRPVLHAVTHPVETVSQGVSNVRNRRGLFGRR